MGFSRDDAQAALVACEWDVEEAALHLLAFAGAYDHASSNNSGNNNNNSARTPAPAPAPAPANNTRLETSKRETPAAAPQGMYGAGWLHLCLGVGRGWKFFTRLERFLLIFLVVFTVRWTLSSWNGPCRPCAPLFCLALRGGRGIRGERGGGGLYFLLCMYAAEKHSWTKRMGYCLMAQFTSK